MNAKRTSRTHSLIVALCFFALFSTPTAVEEDVKAKYGVQVIARTDQLKERFYAISAERRIKHPAVAAITQAAREDLFV